MLKVCGKVLQRSEESTTRQDDREYSHSLAFGYERYLRFKRTDANKQRIDQLRAAHPFAITGAGVGAEGPISLSLGNTKSVVALHTGGEVGGWEV